MGSKMAKVTVRMMYLLGICFLLCMSCISSPYQGIIVTNTSYHSYGKQNGSQITSAKVVKMVESCSGGNLFSWAFYYGQGEDIAKKMKEVGMTKVALIDRRAVSIGTIFFFQECVQIYGE